MAFVGYEPNINLSDSTKTKKNTHNRLQIYRIGVAGFCFSNIMMLSFPEYFSSGNIEVNGLKETFSWIILVLSIPVLLFSASSIFISAWKGIRHQFLNIDVPIALAIVVTFVRSYYEIIGGYGAGYLDSGTGIVFFMLVGRWFQNKTYDSFSFDRDYRSYFPLGVTVIENKQEKNIPVTKLKKGSRIIIRNEEMIPADAVLLNGDANIDYSFVSGENTPLSKNIGELIYAGAKQIGSAIELETVKEVSKSYITQLWNNDLFSIKKNEEKSFIHPWSRYFTIVLFIIAFSTMVIWAILDVTKIFPSVTAVLIVACPCSLLLSATFTYGNMLRIFGRNKLYLKNASVIESLAKIDTVVFDKTGTITLANLVNIHYEGLTLTTQQKEIIKTLTKQSTHPLSKSIFSTFGPDKIQEKLITITEYKEHAGMGIEAVVQGVPVKIGSAGFVKTDAETAIKDTGTSVHILLDKIHMGKFVLQNQYRRGIEVMIKGLKKMKINLHILSGDNDFEKRTLGTLLGAKAQLKFNQSPHQKLEFIKALQHDGHQVLMLGDGLNDAGALLQSQVGIAVSDNSAKFTPASDGIVEATCVSQLHKYIRYAKSGKKIVMASFILSIIYNIVGLTFAVQGLLSPLIAAILMPASSISIVIFVSLYSSFMAHKLKL